MSEFIYREHFPKQKDFVRFVLRKNWKAIHRVQIKSENRKLFIQSPFQTMMAASINEWIKENIHGRWSCSEMFEVFYFEEISDATLFRLKWTGIVPELAEIKQEMKNV
jgi:hypothetical protein